MVNGDWLEVRVYPTPVGVSVYYRQINERKHIEEELSSSRARLAAILGTSERCLLHPRPALASDLCKRPRGRLLRAPS